MATTKTKAPPPPTKTELAAKPATQFCKKGTIVSVDPSIGSASSMPGYAITVDGMLIDSGILSINPREAHNKRLAGIQSQLKALTPNPDVVVCEAIAPMLSVGGPNVIQLHWAVGVILATFPNAHAVLIPNQTWKKHLREAQLTNYIKNDENDALALMCTLYALCQERITNEKDVHNHMLGK